MLYRHWQSPFTNQHWQPVNDKVRMGALAGKGQRDQVKENVQKLLASSQLVYGSLDSVEVIDADAQKGAFLSPLLLLSEHPFQNEAGA
jgi:oxepin-CoA hydrolase/3-oxo-5,6-dehydrosuberyl-CoA semialdehyde dehydrogenase